jgi:hypothetical protein
MPVSIRFATVFFALLLTASLSAADGVIRGEVTDASGGVLPGVTVTATTADGRVVGSAVTDGVGRYVIKTLPIGAITLTFQLDGFDSGTVSVNVTPEAEARVVERLRLAQVTENVVVVAEAPEPPAPYVPTPRPQRYAIVPVPLQELETICLPSKPGTATESIARVLAHLQDSGRTLYGKGDEIIIDAGSADGVEAGRNLVVRRRYRAEHRGLAGEKGEQTTGLVQVMSVGEHQAAAVVVHTCSEVMQGDFIATYTPELRRRAEPSGLPAFGDAIRILFADAGQMLGAPRRLMVIDRGSAQGMQPGQRLTIFRDDPRHIAPPYVIGEAVVVAVKTWSATIRIEQASDAIWDGDWAAPQLASPLEGPSAPLKGSGTRDQGSVRR